MSLEKNSEGVDVSINYGAHIQESVPVRDRDALRQEADREARYNDSFVPTPNNAMKFKSRNGKMVRSAAKKPSVSVNAPRRQYVRPAVESLNEQRVNAQSAKLEAAVAARARRMR